MHKGNRLPKSSSGVDEWAEIPNRRVSTAVPLPKRHDPAQVAKAGGAHSGQEIL